MNEKKNRYDKRLAFQQKMISRLLKENENLKLELKEKDEIINSVASLRSELTENVNVTKKYKEQYKSLIQELKDMKKILNKEVYKNRWWLFKWLLK